MRTRAGRAVAAWASALLLGLSALNLSPAVAQTDALTPALRRLVEAYPEALQAVEGSMLVWKDGTRMPIDDGTGPKTAALRIKTADIKDMLVEAYPAGAPLEAPDADADPGRARSPAFFDKMYGNCRSGDVARHLIDVAWLPKKGGRPLKMTSINGVAGRLARISQELETLPSRFDRFLVPSAGTYNCRVIAGTDRISAHGHGIAIDIAARQADYWRWAPGRVADQPDAAGTWTNRIPVEIVAIFEKHGFIWGGRWSHYDTMHFEYRPELIAR